MVPLALSSFPSLTPFLSSSKILGLYFASSWCPDCYREVTPSLNKFYHDSLLLVDDKEEKKNNEKRLMDIVYISSDDTIEQFSKMTNTFLKDIPFIPFENVKERSELKRYFGTCAGKEYSGLSCTNKGSPFQRKFGIPTLILIDCEKQSILSENGIEELMMSTKKNNDGVNALDGWVAKL